jgi:hypothetical protein
MKTFSKVAFSIVTVVIMVACSVSSALGSCGVGCAAVCRYTCEFSVTGSCSDEEKDRKIQACCSAAFNNTPGINDVPCGPGELN